jgi:hypothetical protein
VASGQTIKDKNNSFASFFHDAAGSFQSEYDEYLLYNFQHLSFGTEAIFSAEARYRGDCNPLPN